MTNLEYMICEAEANGEISINTRDEMLSVITEKKTKAEYRKQKFLKKHDYDPRNGTIKINGRRMHFNDIGGSTKYNEPVFARSAYKDDPENNIKIGINMNTAAFNTKHPTTHEFIAQHEAGHRFSKSHNRKMMRREWDDDERFDTENLEDMIRRQILENNVKRKHGQNIDEYRADYYATKHMKNGYKAQKNSNKDVFKRITKSNKFSKKSKENIKKEFDFRSKMHSFMDKQKEGEYLRK